MTFDITGKIGIITGGASGLGFKYAKELLELGMKGITLADINEEAGRIAEKELNDTFGKGKALFVKTDTTNHREFEEAFKKTVEHFKYVDILVNNAGIMNDGVWEKEIDVNLKGTVNGMLLGIENYLKKYRQGDEALIVNIASVVGTKGYGYMPIYCATKFAINGLTLSWATHYEYSKVRVISFCPGATLTPLLNITVEKVISPKYLEVDKDSMELVEGQQEMDVVAKSFGKVIREAENGTICISEYSQPAYQIEFPKRKLLKDY